MKPLAWVVGGLAGLALLVALYWLSQGRLGKELHRMSAWLEAHKTASPEPSSFTDTDAMARQLGSSARDPQAPRAPTPERDAPGTRK